MLSRFVPIVTAVALSLAFFAGAQAADRVQVVKFRPGASSATVKGSLMGYDMVTYVLGAGAGQSLSVTFAPSNNSCYYNIMQPSGDEPLFDGTTTGNDFSGVLPADGDYRVMTFLMRNAARRNETCNFSITFSIRG